MSRTGEKLRELLPRRRENRSWTAGIEVENYFDVIPGARSEFR